MIMKLYRHTSTEKQNFHRKTVGEELTRVANSLQFLEETAIKFDVSDVLRTTLVSCHTCC